jgi:TPR repeat protein
MRLCFGLFLLLLFGCKHIPVSVDEDVMALAEQGDAASQMKVALAFDKEDDFPEAAFWYQKAAEQGNAAAQYNLGMCYYKGLGVRQDYNEAMRWLRKAAEQGLAEAVQFIEALDSNDGSN